MIDQVHPLYSYIYLTNYSGLHDSITYNPIDITCGLNLGADLKISTKNANLKRQSFSEPAYADSIDNGTGLSIY